LCGQELAPEELYERVLPSVMTLKVETKDGESFVGTAFLALDEGIAVTAWHVISDAIKVTAKFSDNQRFEVVGIVDKNEQKDLALLRVKTTGRPQVVLGSAKPRVGARVYVIGAPKGFDFSITDGLISQFQKVDGFRQYQVSCPISPGNSGGPIVNSKGEVLGVTAWSRKDAQNLNFAIPVSDVLGLNPALPVIAWADLPKPAKYKAPSAVSEKKPSSSEETDSSKAASQLKETFLRAAGKQVTVVVTEEGEEKKFSFTVPNDFVK